MRKNNLNRLVMDIHLNDSDISQMPEMLRTSFLNWLPQYLKTKKLQPGVPVSQQPSKPQTLPTQLTLDLEIDSAYEGQDFEKPSPLATKVNNGSVNGWEYIQVKKNDRWICLDELRKIWRKNND